MESQTTEQRILPAETPNQIRAWLFLNNLAISLADCVKREDPKLIYKKLIKSYYFIPKNDFDFFTQQKLNELFGRNLDTLIIYTNIFLAAENTPFKKMQEFLNTLIPYNNLENTSGLLLKAIDVFQKRLKNLLAMTDEELLGYQQQIQQRCFLYNSDEESNKTVQVNNVSDEDIVTVLDDGVYLLSDFGLQPGEKMTAEDMIGYFNGLIDFGMGSGKSISVVLSLDKPINNSEFDQLFFQLPELLKSGQLTENEPYYTDRFKKVEAMTSFYTKNANYDPELSAIKTNVNDDSHVYEIESTLENPGAKMWTIKFYTLATDSQDFHAVIKRIWLLAKIQNIGIQLPAANDASAYARAAHIVLVMQLLDIWVKEGFPSDKQQQINQINQLVQSKKLLNEYLATDPKKPIEEYKVGILRTAFLIYQTLPIFNKNVLDKEIFLQEMFKHKYKHTYLGKNRGTPLEEYIDAKTENAIKTTQEKGKLENNLMKTIFRKSQVKPSDESNLVEHYHKHNIPPFDKKYRHKAVQEFIDSCINKNKDYKINLRQAIEIAFHLQAALCDAVEYVERKKKVSVTMKQGDAVGSLKETFKLLLKAIMVALNVPSDEQEKVVNEKHLLVAMKSVLNYLPTQVNKLYVEEANEFGNSNTIKPSVITAESPLILKKRNGSPFETGTGTWRSRNKRQTLNMNNLFDDFLKELEEKESFLSSLSAKGNPTTDQVATMSVTLTSAINPNGSSQSQQPQRKKTIGGVDVSMFENSQPQTKK